MSAGVGDLPLGVVQVVLDDADGHAEEAVDPAHPLRVAAGEVVVDRDDVDALALERVEIGRQRGDERLAFAGLHLGDLALVQDGAADELDVEVPHVQHAAAGLADDGKRLGQQVVERLALGEPLLGTRRSCRAAARRDSAWIAGSSALTSPTIGRSRFSSRSFWVPTTLARSVWIIYGVDVTLSIRDCNGPGWGDQRIPS